MTNDASQHSYFYFKEKRLTSKRERERKACPEQKMTSASASSAPEEEEKGSCGTCGQPASLKCAGCKLVSYCDKNCQANEKCHLRNCCKNFKILFNLP